MLAFENFEKGSKMQEQKKEMGCYEFMEFLIRKGALSILANRIVKAIFNNYGILPKDYALFFQEVCQAYFKTLLKKQGWGFSKTPDQEEQEYRQLIYDLFYAIDFSQIAQDRGDHYFFPKICQERQSMDLALAFMDSKGVESMFKTIFSFSKQIQSYVISNYLKSKAYGGLFGNFEIPMESFKQDLLERFPSYNPCIQKAFYRLNPYLSKDKLCFEITKRISLKPEIDSTSKEIKAFCQFLEQEKFDKQGLINSLCSGLSTNRRITKRLVGLYLEKNYGLLSQKDCLALGILSADYWGQSKTPSILKNSSFKANGQVFYYIQEVLRAWVIGRLKEIFSKKTLAHIQQSLLNKLTPEHIQVFRKCSETSGISLMFQQKRCLEIVASHLNLPIKVKILEDGECIFEKDVDFIPNVFLIQTPRSVKEVRYLLDARSPREPDVREHKEHQPSRPTTRQTTYKGDAVLEKERQSKETIDFPTIKEHTPQALKAYLDRHIVGQERAKEAFCVEISDHYARFIGKQVVHEKSNVLFIGPSGCGKTYMTKTLLEHLGIPYNIVDASHLTPEGYKGNDVSNIFVGLYQNAGKDIQKAQNGVIFLDEVDKLGLEVNDHQFKSLVQTELLKIIEGHTLTFSYGKQDIVLDTSKILFIFAGHFKGLDYRRTNKPRTIGFRISCQPISKLSQPNTPIEVSDADLVRCGLIPEFIGRISVRIVLGGVDVKMLESAFDKEVLPYQREFSQYKNCLEFTPEARASIINQAMHGTTGMRAIKEILKKVVNPLRFSMQQQQGYKYTITKDTLQTGKADVVEIGEDWDVDGF